MKLKGNFKVVEYTNATKTTSWRVTGTKHDGTRIRENYHVQAEALGRKQDLEIEAANGETTGPKARATRLTVDQLSDAEAAIQIADGKISLAGAVQWWKDNYREPVKPMLLSDALTEFLDDKKKENCRPDTLRNLNGRVGMFSRAFAGKKVGDIQAGDVKTFIHREGLSPVAKSNDRRALVNFFKWCIGRDYCAENPVAKVGTVIFDGEEPEVMPLADVKALLKAATEFKKGRLIPYVVLGTFAGLRPKELARITWADIDLAAKTVTLSAKVAKMRERRIVELSPNAIKWLRPHATEQTPIKGLNWRRDFDKVKEIAGYNGREKTTVEIDGKKRTLKAWPQDLMRHTAISHHLVKHQHEGKTAAWAGNSPDMIHKHYRGLVKAKEAKAFWQIMP
jgi:integrase